MNDMTTSIYDFVQSARGSEALPDQGDMTLRDDERWIPGAFEAILLRSSYRIKQNMVVNFYISRILKRYVLKPTSQNYDGLMKYLARYSAISLVDPLISFMTASKVDSALLRSAALTFATKSNKREVVKLGIAMLGQWGKPEDLDILKILGLHEEFTLFAVGAISVMFASNPKAKNANLIYIGDNTFGWGKLSVLYELDYSDFAARDWTLRRGCRNDLGLSYAANVCAIKGRMASVLEQVVDDDIDKELFCGLCDIFTGLLEMNPDNDTISQYPKANEAAQSFLKLVSLHSDVAAFDERTENIINKLREYKYIGG